MCVQVPAPLWPPGTGGLHLAVFSLSPLPGPDLTPVLWTEEPQTKSDLRELQIANKSMQWVRYTQGIVGDN